jgi:predicted Zn-dependent protease
MDMSTLSIAPAFDFAVDTRRPRARDTTVRLTQRGRVVFVLAFLAAAFTVMVAFGGWATATHDAGTPDPVRVVEVQEGDTLYDIAGRVAQPGQVREMVLKIEHLNSLPGAQIQVGQKLAIPAS